MTSKDTSNVDFLMEVWEKAVQIAMGIVKERTVEVCSEVSNRLVELGRYEDAAEFLEGIEAHKEAIDLYIRAGMLDKARAITEESAPHLASYLQQETRFGNMRRC